MSELDTILFSIMLVLLATLYAVLVIRENKIARQYHRRVRCPLCGGIRLERYFIRVDGEYMCEHCARHQLNLHR